MAVVTQEVEVLTPGMDQNHPEKGQYYQNLYYKNGSLTVRPGFGQLAQYDTTMAMPEVTRTGVHEAGYYKPLGSHVLVTNFGHKQIVSVHSSNCFTGEYNDRGSWTKVYTVNIYDITTGERWEEVISRHTSEMSKDVSPITEWHGIYETNKDKDYGGWLYAGDSQVFFEESNDALFFGSKELGFRVYIPADFNTNRRKQVNGTTSVDAAPPYSETSIVLPVYPADGQYEAAYVYLTSSTMFDPVDAAAIGTRMAIARDRDVFFSDEGRPASFMALNVISIPSEFEITAIEAVNDNLLIFTESETFLYQPNITGALVSAGRLNSLSRSVGCIGPAAITKAEGSLVWMDKNGVYLSSGMMDLKKISEPIQPFFDSSISNPLSSYLDTDTIANTQPRSFFDSRDLSAANMAYDAINGMVMISIPNQNIIWVYQAQQWLLWNLESVVYGGAVGVRDNINSSRVLAIGGDIYLVGGIEKYDATASNRDGVVATAKATSFYILEFGRGGGLDRSVHQLEDNREFVGHYSFLDGGSPASTPGTAFYIDKPVKMRPGFYPTITDDVYMVPISFVLPYSSEEVRALKLDISFDSTILQPFAINVGLPNIEYYIPDERIGSSASWTSVQWDGTSLKLHWVSGTSMNLGYGKKNPLLFIPMKAVQTTDDHVWLGVDLGGAGNEMSFTNQASPAPATTKCDLYYWNQFVPKIAGKHVNDSSAQPVDWVAKSGQIGAKDEKQIRLRTIFTKALTSGPATANQFTSNAKLMNMVLSCDWKDYVGQAIDFLADGGIRSENDSTSSRDRDRNFFGAASTWNDSILVDDQQYDTLASSQSVKGEHVSVMAFGHIRDKAESLSIDSVKASYRLAGGRRRKGR